MAPSITLRPGAPFLNASEDPAQWAVKLTRTVPGVHANLGETIGLTKSQAERLVRDGRAEFVQKTVYSDRLNMMGSFHGYDDLNDFLQMGRPGFIRDGLDPVTMAAVSRYHAQELFESSLAPVYQALQNLGATPVILCSRTPSWLSPSADTDIIPGSGWQTLQAHPPVLTPPWYRNIHRDAARHLAGLGVTGLYWEGWNEPVVGDPEGVFFRGTQEQLFDTWADMYDGIKEGDPTAKVGTMGVVPWAVLSEGSSTRTLLAEFLEWAIARGTPPDWMNWHEFSGQPDTFLAGSSFVDELKRSADLSIPSILTEWNHFNTLTGADPTQDGAKGAAFVAGGLADAELWGLDAVIYANLDDNPAVTPPNLFTGFQGILTYNPTVKKASYFVYTMLSRLHGRRVLVEFSPDARPSGIRAMAAIDGQGTARIIVSRWPQDLATAVREFFQVEGLSVSGGEYVSLAEMSAYISGEPLPSRVPGALVPTFQGAKAAALVTLAQGSGSVTLDVDLSELGTPSAYRLYRINSGVGNNPYSAFEDAGGASEYATALAAAQAVEFSVTSSGTGAIPQLTLEDHEVVLIEADF